MTTSFCMCSQRFAIRVFDPDSKYIWEDQEHVHGDPPFLARADLTQNGIDEIIVYQRDHGRTRLIVFATGKNDSASGERVPPTRRPEQQIEHSEGLANYERSP
jgi:hypothetical protein